MAKQPPKNPLEGVRVLKPSELQKLKGGARPGPEASPPPVAPDPLAPIAPLGNDE